MISGKYSVRVLAGHSESTGSERKGGESLIAAPLSLSFHVLLFIKCSSLHMQPGAVRELEGQRVKTQINHGEQERE